MSELYTLNIQINDLLPKVAEKFKLGTVFEEIYYPEWMAEHGGISHISDMDIYDDFSCSINGSDQIRQILFALKDILGGCKDPHNYLIPLPEAERLCRNWLNGLTPLIDSEPETVLKFLINVLNELLD